MLKIRRQIYEILPGMLDLFQLAPSRPLKKRVFNLDKAIWAICCIFIYAVILTEKKGKKTRFNVSSSPALSK